MKNLICLTAVALAGCAGVPTEVTKLNAPAPYLMAAPCKLPEIPSTEGNPADRASYYSKSRACHGRAASQVRGLQSYVRKVRGS